MSPAQDVAWRAGAAISHESLLKGFQENNPRASVAFTGSPPTYPYGDSVAATFGSTVRKEPVEGS